MKILDGICRVNKFPSLFVRSTIESLSDTDSTVLESGFILLIRAMRLIAELVILPHDWLVTKVILDSKAFYASGWSVCSEFSWSVSVVISGALKPN
jgi:hypothetical protein